MRCFVTILLLLLDHRSHSRTTHAAKIKDENKVVQGFYATMGMFPYAGFLSSYDPTNRAYHECGSSIISSSAIATACHCLASVQLRVAPSLYDPKRSYVIVGSNNRRIEEQGTNSRYPGFKPSQIRAGKEFVIHYLCGRRGIGEIVEFDFGIMVVNRPFDLNNFVQPMPYPSYNKISVEKYYRDFDAKGKICQFIGWGLTQMGNNMNEQASKWLQVARVAIIEGDTCTNKIRQSNRNYPEWKSFRGYDRIGAGHFCGTPYENATVHRKDMGGPIICDNFVVGLIASQMEISERYWKDVNVIVFLSFWYTYDELRDYFPGGIRDNTNNQVQRSSKGSGCCFNPSPVVIFFVLNVFVTQCLVRVE